MFAQGQFSEGQNMKLPTQIHSIDLLKAPKACVSSERWPWSLGVHPSSITYYSPASAVSQGHGYVYGNWTPNYNSACFGGQIGAAPFDQSSVLAGPSYVGTCNNGIRVMQVVIR